jgi:hypothetical protein
MSMSREKKYTTVRSVLNTISFMRKKGRFIPEISDELLLAENECIYRQVILDLITSIHSQVRVCRMR